MGGNGDFENRHTIFDFFTYRPEILHMPRERNTQVRARRIFEFPPLENLAPL